MELLLTLSFQRWTHQDPPSSDSDWPWTWWYIKPTQMALNQQWQRVLPYPIKRVE